MEKQKKYVWLDKNTGEFSNSWSEDEHKKLMDSYIDDWGKESLGNGWIIIEYTPLNDPTFEITKHFKLR